MIQNHTVQPESGVPTDGSGKTRTLSIFVLIDALGWEYLKDREFLNDFLSYRTPLRTVLGFSSGAIPAMLTGSLPCQNGHWNLFYYDPTGSPFRWLRHFTFLPERVLNHRITSKLLKELGKRLLGLGPLFDCFVRPSLLPWFNWVEKRNIYDRGGISETPSVFDLLAAEGVPHRVYSYHACTDEEILRRARLDIESGCADFFFLYLSELDMVLHHNCERRGPAEQRLNWYAAELRGIFDAARVRDPGATFVVTSDHGMAPVRCHFDLVGEIQHLNLSMPNDYLAVYDSTMARFWFFNERARGEILGRLESLPCGRILGDSELERLGILFPDRRFGQTIFLLHPGWLMSESDFNGRGWRPSGMHGYHPDDPYSDAIFLSNRQPSFALKSIVDVFRCMREAF